MTLYYGNDYYGLLSFHGLLLWITIISWFMMDYYSNSIVIHENWFMTWWIFLWITLSWWMIQELVSGNDGGYLLNMIVDYYGVLKWSWRSCSGDGHKPLNKPVPAIYSLEKPLNRQALWRYHRHHCHLGLEIHGFENWSIHGGCLVFMLMFLYWIYPLVNVYITMENHHFHWVNQL